MSVAGVVFLVLGLLIAVPSAWWCRRQLRFRGQARRVVVVPAAGATAASRDFALRPVEEPERGAGATSAATLQLRLAPALPPVAVNPGDEILVRPDQRTPSQAWLYRPEQTAMAVGYALYGLFCVVTGGALLTRPSTSSGGDSVITAAVTVGLGALGVLGVVLAALTARDLAGSKRVSGRVLDVHLVSTARKATYQPLVEYQVDGSVRRVWGTPRWFKPKVDYPASVRISGRPPHEAVRSTPLVVSGMLLLLLTGAVGWLLIVIALLGVG